MNEIQSIQLQFLLCVYGWIDSNELNIYCVSLCIYWYGAFRRQRRITLSVVVYVSSRSRAFDFLSDAEDRAHHVSRALTPSSFRFLACLVNKKCGWL